MSYKFIDKEVLRNRAKDITSRIEKMYDIFGTFIEVLEGLKKDAFVSFTALELKAGLTPKKITALKNAIEEYRRIYFDMLSKIYQTNINDFMDIKGGKL